MRLFQDHLFRERKLNARTVIQYSPLGRAGLTEADVHRTGRRTLSGKRPVTKVGRAVEKGETQGFMEVLVDAETREIVGAAILGTGATK